jgi:hypothetical protein
LKDRKLLRKAVQLLKVDDKAVMCQVYSVLFDAVKAKECFAEIERFETEPQLNAFLKCLVAAPDFDLASKVLKS